ncbi:hypothetical protein [Actinoplanes solisilvae]|uniref:hypothetical protein n=1 Tax=Actinoplanes solisilvae TaxID=2486853 RepID=UPI000FD834A2|nr:hypothetical protein [Actinoplanes solisilvae]
MIATLRSELHRTLTIPSSWGSMAAATLIGLSFSWFSVDFWSLFAALGVFGIAVITTSQHYQHRTAVLLFLGQPRRLRVLAAQGVTAIVIGLATVLVSGIAILPGKEWVQYFGTLAATPLLALFAVASATVIRRPIWLFVGFGGWFVFVDGLIFRFKQPLPFTALIQASGGHPKGLLIFTVYTVAALILAGWAIRRDLSTD